MKCIYEAGRKSEVNSGMLLSIYLQRWTQSRHHNVYKVCSSPAPWQGPLANYLEVSVKKKNKNIHTHKGALQNTPVLYLSFSFFLYLTNFKMYTFILFIQPDIFPMEIWSYTKVKNGSLCYFILTLKHSASSWEPRESFLASLFEFMVFLLIAS